MQSEERIKEFIAIYKKEYGEELSHGEARIILDRLLGLYTALARPLPSERRDDRSKKS